MSSYFEPAPADPFTSAQAASIVKILLSGTTQIPLILPVPAAGPNITIVSGGGGGVYGAWVQLVASGVRPANDLLTHIYVTSNDGNANNRGYIDVGVGGAGSEVVIGTWGWGQQSQVGPSLIIPVFPWVKIVGNPRVALRNACNFAATSLLVQVGVCPGPLA